MSRIAPRMSDNGIGGLSPVEVVFEMVLGDYLAVLASAVKDGDNPPELLVNFCKGMHILAKKHNVHWQTFDSDNIMGNTLQRGVTWLGNIG